MATKLEGASFALLAFLESQPGKRATRAQVMAALRDRFSESTIVVARHVAGVKWGKNGEQNGTTDWFL